MVDNRPTSPRWRGYGRGRGLLGRHLGSLRQGRRGTAPSPEDTLVTSRLHRCTSSSSSPVRAVDEPSEEDAPVRVNRAGLASTSNAPGSESLNGNGGARSSPPGVPPVARGARVLQGGVPLSYASTAERVPIRAQRVAPEPTLAGSPT